MATRLWRCRGDMGGDFDPMPLHSDKKCIFMPKAWAGQNRTRFSQKIGSAIMVAGADPCQHVHYRMGRTRGK